MDKETLLYELQSACLGTTPLAAECSRKVRAEVFTPAPGTVTLLQQFGVWVVLWSADKPLCMSASKMLAYTFSCAMLWFRDGMCVHLLQPITIKGRKN